MLRISDFGYFGFRILAASWAFAVAAAPLAAQGTGPETENRFPPLHARPGLRVRLVGPKGNPDGIGAMMRLKFKDGYGPVRELHAGSGYWSQDSLTMVLATPSSPSEIEVRWPGGKTVTSVVADGAREIRLGLGDGIR